VGRDTPGRVRPQADIRPAFGTIPDAKKFDPAAFALDLAHKDVTLATEVGREFHVPMKLANTVLQEMTEAMNREGWPKRDSRIFMLLQEERAGVNIKVPEDKVQEVLKRD